MYGLHQGHLMSSVVILNLNFEGVTIMPAKANPPLPVDTNAELSETISLESFQMVCWRTSQVHQSLCPVQHAQFPEGSPLEMLRQSTGFLPLEQPPGLTRSERPNHPTPRL